MGRRRYLTYPNVAATIALVLSMSGAAVAANHYLITSTKQISPKVIRTLRGAKGATGAAGATGPVGPAGQRGAKGDTGPTGPPGQDGLRGPEGQPAATVAAASPGSNPPPTGGANTGILELPRVNLTTPTKGGVVAMATEISVQVECPAATGFNCNFEVGLFIDGQPMTGSRVHVLIPNGTSPSKTFSLSGVGTAIAAGTHEVTVDWNGSSFNPSTVKAQFGEPHLTAYSLGG